MIVENLLKTLKENPDQSLHIILPDESFVPSNFHITEVALVYKQFIDCGGTVRNKTYCTLQVWVANDVDHRLNSTKLAKIIDIGLKNFLQTDLEVEIEYETNVVAQYPLNSMVTTPSGILFITGDKHTACLAPDKCGVSGCC